MVSKRVSVLLRGGLFPVFSRDSLFFVFLCFSVFFVLPVLPVFPVIPVIPRVCQDEFHATV